MTTDTLVREESSSPHELSFYLHPYITSIEQIANEHGLHHDSGVSIKSSSSGMSKTSRTKSLRPPGQETIRTDSSLDPSDGSTLDNGAGSSTLKRQSGSMPEGEVRTKRVIESPGLTGEFDAREDAWCEVSRRLKPFGDTLRHERLRTELGETALGKDCVGLLTYSTDLPNDSDALLHAQVEMMRILANLCIDHDVNREKMLSEGAPQAIVRLLGTIAGPAETKFTVSVLQLFRTAAGALLNMQLDHPSTRETLRKDPNVVRVLLQLATDRRIYRLGSWFQPQSGGNAIAHDAEEWRKHIHTGSSVSTWAWRIAQDVCADEGDSEGEKKRDSDEDDAEKTIESLVSIGALQAISFLIQPFIALLTPPQSPTVKGSWSADDVADLMESDMDVVQIAAELLESCAFDSQQFRLAALQPLAVSELIDTDAISATASGKEQNLLGFLVHFLDVGRAPLAWSFDRPESNYLPPKPSDEEAAKDVASNFVRARAAIARAIVGIVAEDENMSKLFEGKEAAGQSSSFLETMKSWMTRDPKQHDDLVSTAMLAVGNLARKDTHCLALVHEHDLVPALTATLSPSSDIKVAHGVICLLKNLAIPSANKQIIGQSNDLIVRIAPFLGTSMDKVQPLQFASVGLLKHLCAGCLANANELVLKDTLNALLTLLGRTDDVPTRMEGTRVLVNAIKTIWSSKTAEQGESSIQRQDARKRLTTELVATALAQMVKGSSKYPVLVNEGILALTLLASQREQVPTGTLLVAQALQSIVPSRKTSSASEQKNAEDGGSIDASGGAAGQSLPPPPQLPQRQTTLDALASSANQALPRTRSAADMIAIVLSRRDARMPPQFANNACALVQTLVQSAAKGSDDAAYVTTLALAWQPALEQLSALGPQETVATAQRALTSVKEFLR